MTSLTRSTHAHLVVCAVIVSVVLTGCGVIRIEPYTGAPDSSPVRRSSSTCMPPAPVPQRYIPMPTSPDSIGSWATESAMAAAEASSANAALMAAYHRCLAFGDTL